MKKLFSLLSVFVLIVAISGCTVDQSQIEDLEKQIEDLQKEVDLLESGVELRDTTIADLQAEITALQDLLWDNLITVTFTGNDGDYISEVIGFDDNYEGSLFELLDAHVEIEYMDTDFGKMITGIENITTSAGNYVSFIKNGEPSMVGVEGATFEDGDIFGFEHSWWDANLEAIHNAIELFMANQVDTFLSETIVDYNVAVALGQMGVLEDYITDTEIETYLATLTPATVTDYFKIIMIKESADLDASAEYTALNAMVTPGAYGQTGYGLLAFNAGATTEDFSAFETAALADLTLDGNTPFDLGLDAGAISLIALAMYATETGVQTEIDDFLTWIQADQLASGGVQTREVVWNETTYPGTENAATISQVILALLAVGSDPAGAEYTAANGTLVSRLIEFQTETGSFDWVLDDELTEDLAFSTPQAFLALVSYQLYANDMMNSSYNPFSFTE